MMPDMYEGMEKFVQISRKKILIPLFEDYYLFQYLYVLASKLQERNYHVVIMVSSSQTSDIVRRMTPAVEVRRFPRLITFLNNRGRFIVLRLALYCVTFMWVRFWLRREFQFSVVPWTTRPVWNIVSRVIPSLTVNNVSNLSVIEDSIAEHKFDHNAPRKLAIRFGFMLDRLGIVKLRRVRGELINFNRDDVIESLLGLRSIHRENGCNGIQHLCVMGSEYLNNYREIGVDHRKTEITIVGNPSYEFCYQLHKEFGKEQKREFLQENGLPENQILYSFFISPSSLTEEQINEIMIVVNTISMIDDKAHFVVKLHPKTNTQSVKAVREALVKFEGEVTLFTEFTNDVFNAKLIKCSRAIIQKQSTLGFLALIFRVPILSYNLIDTDYHDDLFKLLGISFHNESEGDLKASLRMLDDQIVMKAYFKRMKNMEEKYCRFEKSPCDNVADIIDRHFRGQVRRDQT